jgi:hypothetical protein
MFTALLYFDSPHVIPTRILYGAKLRDKLGLNGNSKATMPGSAVSGNMKSLEPLSLNQFNTLNHHGG